MAYPNLHLGEDINAALPRTLAGRMLSVLLMLSGLVTASSLLLPASANVDRVGVLSIAVIALVIGVIAWFLPWPYLPRKSMLRVVLVAFLLIGLHNYFSGADPYRYSIFFLVLFAWLGIAQPRGTALWFVPLLIVTYLAPMLLLRRDPAAISSVFYIVPVCLFISESLAWVAERLRRVQTALSQSEVRFRSLAQHASDMVLITAGDTTIRYLSPSVERILGYTSAMLLRIKLTDVIHPDDLPQTLATFDLALQQPNAIPSFECRVRHRDGTWRYLETTSTNLLADPNVQGIVLNSRDITERKELEAQLKHQAFHDPLTGLVNRAAFSDRAEHALTRGERHGTALAVLFLDLDNFKTINDNLGHAAGDDLLVAVAERLRACLRASDVAARLGGDEFAILLEDISDTNNVVHAAERLLESLRQPFTIEGQSINVSVSIGIAWSRAGQSAADLLRHADMAMYSVKHTGKGRYAVFDPSVHLSQTQELALDLDRSL
jgi:diguanylate cyclase (GGDEF)-like protein/PAS domain S-box-containing protein